MDAITRVHAHIDENFEAYLEEIKRYLRLPGISQTGQGIRESAALTREFVTSLAHTEARLVETDGNPVVFGRTAADSAGAKTLLLYCFYDVVPAAAEDWACPPFDPTVLDPARIGLPRRLRTGAVRTRHHGSPGPPGRGAAGPAVDAGGLRCAAGERDVRHRGRGGDRLSESSRIRRDPSRAVARRGRLLVSADQPGDRKRSPGGASGLQGTGLVQPHHPGRRVGRDAGRPRHLVRQRRLGGCTGAAPDPGPRQPDGRRRPDRDRRFPGPRAPPG